MKIYTKTGDGGQTSLFGGKRVAKDDLRIEAYGTVDELNSVLGLVASFSVWTEIKRIVYELQKDLFRVGADLATPMEKGETSKIKRTDEEMVLKLEKEIDRVDKLIPELKNFILPGGNDAAAFLHFGRTVCRRAERRVVSLNEIEKVNEKVKVYLNRLSDFLFVLSRYENYLSGNLEVEWKE